MFETFLLFSYIFSWENRTFFGKWMCLTLPLCLKTVTSRFFLHFFLKKDYFFLSSNIFFKNKFCDTFFRRIVTFITVHFATGRNSKYYGSYNIKIFLDFIAKNIHCIFSSKKSKIVSIFVICHKCLLPWADKYKLWKGHQMFWSIMIHFY